ncbi:TPA: hypothetical protein DDZ01_03480 [Candidatus Uhrbacteria bacterium]|nr:MAG: primase protein [Candidatus Uhrbacteria bacterium GW2011_GWF2_40_263]OGL97383.1 MAG: hypothetical protein A2332_04660 [Candidatus Uhrbacteria bacterium RIFOXYB2_FULL_41_18]HBK35028.1 hypothetical protein [Candidatus Uhrbacteria bacterium]HCB56181.1 hypothetical protein [Candidatus Uhrbacteria bacterium]
MKIQNDEDWEIYLYLREIEKEWRRNNPAHREHELLKIFPDAKPVITEKIREWEQIRDEFFNTIKKRLTVIKHTDDDDFSKWFWREWIKETDGKKLMEAEGHIKRLKRLLWATKEKKPPKDWVTGECKALALSVPIEDVLDREFRRTGRTLTALCPFHDEKTASFTVYSDQNRYWCFGCNQGGDVIHFIQSLHNYSFKEAVRYLID